MLLFNFQRLEEEIMDFLKTFCQNWQKKIALSPHSMVIAACSGGIDSLALLDMLWQMKARFQIEVAAAHYEHGIRGEDSLGDAAFVQEFCRQQGIAFYLGSGNVPLEASQKNESLETAARRMRYGFLYGLRDKLMAEGTRGVYIATAHHGDDQAETLLMHLLRGSGIRGLGGIRSRQGCLIRPLLFARKSQLTAYCQTRGLTPRHDSSNDELEFLRNRIRLELLPLLEREYNPALTEGLCHLAELAAQDEDFLQANVKNAWDRLVHQEDNGYRCSCLELKRLPEAILGRLLQKMAGELAEDRQLSYRQLEDIKHLLEIERTGSKLDLPYGLQVEISYKFIYFYKKTIPFSENNVTMDNMDSYEDKHSMYLSLPGELKLPDGRLIRGYLADALPDILPEGAIYGDADKCVFPIVLRHRQPGDRVRLSQGSKKLKDFLIDARVPRQLRDELWLAVSQGEILWLVGKRRFAHALASESTNKYFILEVK